VKEILEIIDAFDKAQLEGKQAALVTLVHVDGSSYRRPGARMLVTEEGGLTGAISGGCLEGDALKKAQHAMYRQKNMLVTYDTTDEDDAKMGLGLGCNGIIQVLMQPVDNLGEDGPMQILKKLKEGRKSSVLVTLFSLNDKRSEQLGTCIYKSDEGTEYFKGISKQLKDLVDEDIERSFSERRTLFKNYRTESADITAYIEFIPPPVSLVIAGAGNDAEPVAAFASILGWQTTLIDDGRDKNTKIGRFAGTCKMVIRNPENVLGQLEIDDRTVFLLMTHNYNYDLAMLRQLMKKNVRYVGVLGPRKKINRMLEELSQEGMHLSGEQLSSVYSPVGLDIGAETPEEIALSMIAEIKAVLSGRDGQPLKRNSDVIHPRESTFIEIKNYPHE
jgi:xanthine dehydrogenase accessory factor